MFSKSNIRLKLATRVMIVAGIFLVLSAGLGFTYFRETQQRDDVASQLAIADRALLRKTVDLSQWEDQLVQAWESIPPLRDSFPTVVPGSTYLDIILQMASESDLKVRRIDVSPKLEVSGAEATAEKAGTGGKAALEALSRVLGDEGVTVQSVAETQYVVSPFRVSAQGTISQILAFLERLETGPLETLVIEDTNFVGQGDDFSFTVAFSVYGMSSMSDGVTPISSIAPLPASELANGLLHIDIPYRAMDTADGMCPWRNACDATLVDAQEFLVNGLSGIDYVELYFRAVGNEEYTRYVTEVNPDGRWRQSPIPFIAPYASGYQWFTRAVDRAGNVEDVPVRAAAALTLVDQEGPLAPEVHAGGGYTAGNITWDGTTDDGSGVAGYYLQVSQDSSFATVDWAREWDSSTEAYVGNVNDGVTYHFRVRAKDNAGNLGPWSTAIAITADLSSPSGHISINDGSEFITTSESLVRMEATDGGSGVAQMAFSYDGLEYTSWQPYSPSRVWPVDRDGQHLIYVKFKDAVGNESDAIYATIVRDTVKPSVVEAYPVDGSDDVGSYPLISAMLSEAMEKAYLTEQTFFVTDEEGQVPGTISWDPDIKRLFFVPTTSLDSGTTYWVTLTTRAMDLAGLGLEEDYSWSFTIVDGSGS